MIPRTADTLDALVARAAPRAGLAPGVPPNPEAAHRLAIFLRWELVRLDLEGGSCPEEMEELTRWVEGLATCTDDDFRVVAPAPALEVLRPPWLGLGLVAAGVVLLVLVAVFG